MFTGLVEARARVVEVERSGTGLSLRVSVPGGWTLERGQSVCVSGACLSIASLEDTAARFDLSRETLARTWFERIEVGDEVNLERALRLSDRLDGHLVTGHVDGQGRLAAARDAGDGGKVLTFDVEEGFERYLVEKGSVAVDGVSLTVVAPRGRSFDVAVIPLTLEKTTLGRAKPSDAVNLEADPIGKWVERLVRR